MSTRFLRTTQPLAVLAITAGVLGPGSTAACAAAQAAANPMATSPARVPAPGVGYIRLARLSPAAPAVDVYLYSFGHAGPAMVLSQQDYGAASPYQAVVSGDYAIATRPAGDPAAIPALSATMDVTNGHAYTLAGIGPGPRPRLQVIADRLNCPPGRAMVRVIQASRAQRQVTVTIGGRALSLRQSFASVTPYRAVPPGTWTVRATGASGQATSRLTFLPGSAYTLAVLDDAGHLAIGSLAGAGASNIEPVGGAAAGFGGTAPKPAGSPVPWLVLAVAGLLLVSTAGVTRLRQIRWARRAAAHLR